MRSRSSRADLQGAHRDWVKPATTSRTLVNSLGTRAHISHPVTDLLTQEHATAARLGALSKAADHDLNGIGPAQIVGVRRRAADTGRPLSEWSRSSGVMPPSPVRGRGARLRRPRPNASFGASISAPKDMPAMAIGIFNLSGFWAKRPRWLHRSHKPHDTPRAGNARSRPHKQQIIKRGGLSFAPLPRMS